MRLKKVTWLGRDESWGFVDQISARYMVSAYQARDLLRKHHGNRDAVEGELVCLALRGWC